MIGNLHVAQGALVVTPLRDRDLAHRDHAPRRREPADHGLVPDAHVHDVVAAQRDVVAPVQRLLAIDEARVLRRRQLDREHLADIALGEQLREGAVDLECGRRGHQLRDERRRASGGLEHPSAFGGIHRHARLAQHVFARGERGQRDLAVHVRPRPDADGVDVGRAHELAPVRVHARDPEFLGDALARLARAIGHGHELDVRLLAEARDVTTARVLARSHESDADCPAIHGASW